MRLHGKLGGVLRRLLRRKPAAAFSSVRVSLAPDGIARGRVLIAYVLEPFLDRGSARTNHTHHAECVLMAQVWRSLGYAVDVIDYRNSEFMPSVDYDYFVSARTHLERIGKRLGAGCRRVAHFDTSHFTVNNRATFQRLIDLQQRRGVSLPRSARLIESNQAAEAMDLGMVLGNAVTLATYAYAGKPLQPLSVPGIATRAARTTKRFDQCRTHFLWLGSGGLVHKGLDLVLEAFAQMPEMHLTVCGPLDQEPEFGCVYQRELALPNVRTTGWIDVTSDAFRDLAADTLGIVYPSCAEGQAGAVVNAVQAGLLPIISRESGLDVDGFGETLVRNDVATICDAVRAFAAEDDAHLAQRMDGLYHYADARHSHEAYARQYGQALAKILQ